MSKTKKLVGFKKRRKTTIKSHPGAKTKKRANIRGGVKPTTIQGLPPPPATKGLTIQGLPSPPATKGLTIQGLPRDAISHLVGFLDNKSVNNVTKLEGTRIKSDVETSLKVMNRSNKKENTRFMKALGVYATQFISQNTDKNPTYTFNIPKIRTHLSRFGYDNNIESLTMSYGENGEFKLKADEKMIKTYGGKNSKIIEDNVVDMVIEFLPNDAYDLISRFLKGKQLKMKKSKKEETTLTTVVDVDGGKLCVFSENPTRWYGFLEKNESRLPNIPVDYEYKKESLIAVVVNRGVSEILRRQFTLGRRSNDGGKLVSEYIGSIALPSSINYISEFGFTKCSSLQSINIPDSVTRMDDFTFTRCSKLTSIKLPKSIERIGEGMFKGCNDLTTVIIPDSVVEIKKSAFSSCHSLSQVILPSSLITIGKNAFSMCFDLTNVIIPDSTVSIGEGAFSYCDILERVHIGESIKSIGENAFMCCKNLGQVTLGRPTKITTGKQIFSGCIKLKTIPESLGSHESLAKWRVEECTEIGDSGAEWSDAESYGSAYDYSESDDESDDESDGSYE